MRVRVDQGADAVYLQLTDRPIQDSQEVAKGIVLDYDAEGRIAGIEVLDASKLTDDPAALSQFSFELPPGIAPHSADVDSTTLGTAEYDENTLQLDITFANGKTYRYFGVPQMLYAELIAAKSKGAFFNEKLRGAFPYKKLEAREGARLKGSAA
jgi:uncharacterized protein YuzE